MYFIEALKFSIKKAFQYPANLISWFCADVALYAATILAYYFLAHSFSNFAGYSRYEIVLYICNFSLVNNLSAIFFAEAESDFGDSLISGRFGYYALKPRTLLKNYIYLNINLPAVCATPFLIAAIVVFARLSGVRITVLYALAIITAAADMGLLFFIINALALFGVRPEALNTIAMQVLSAAEKPDTIFPKAVRRLLYYFVPVLLFSSFPTRVLLGKISLSGKIWGFGSMFELLAIFWLLLREGRKHFQAEEG